MIISGTIMNNHASLKQNRNDRTLIANLDKKWSNAYEKTDLALGYSYRKVKS
jgi:hypothetical protein